MVRIAPSGLSAPLKGSANRGPQHNSYRYEYDEFMEVIKTAAFIGAARVLVGANMLLRASPPRTALSEFLIISIDLLAFLYDECQCGCLRNIPPLTAFTFAYFQNFQILLFCTFLFSYVWRKSLVEVWKSLLFNLMNKYIHYLLVACKITCSKLKIEEKIRIRFICYFFYKEYFFIKSIFL